MIKEYLTVEEVGELFGITPATVCYRSYNGIIPEGRKVEGLNSRRHYWKSKDIYPLIKVEAPQQSLPLYNNPDCQCEELVDRIESIEIDIVMLDHILSDLQKNLASGESYLGGGNEPA